ncbi:UNVERIFIED_CONTAM: Exocyst complex component EXO70B1 [Sesamum calycinum]|uniref:Exocyst subunit Exo70 family protein n=1 Tax=Sesamum calycinum TaxID=2727403 RepID=A0AAW2SXK3_9LAMI
MEPPESTAAEKVILQWDSTASEDARERMIFTGDRHEIDRYLDAVDELQKAMSSATLSDSSSTTSSALQIAMARLEDEFRNILLSHTSPVEADWLTESTQLEFASQEFELKEEIAESSSDKQFEHQESNSSSTSSCYKTTSSVRSVRKSAVDASLKKLNVEKLSIGDIQRLEWETLETKIRRWIRAAKICVRVLFASERRLCEEIFEGLGTSADDACFMETIKSPAIQLFNFAEAISISRRSPEKLFKILDLHDALSDLLPDIESVFESKSSESIRVQAVEILSRLAEAARGILSEFENAVLREPSKVPVPGGTIHPLTRYVMNYISLISDYKQTLIELIVSKPSTGSRYSSDPNVPDVDLSEYEGQASTLALHLIWIIVILQFNLDGKSKHYKDASLAHLFMMNNVHYIVQKIKGSPELREMIGDDYLKKLTGKFRLAATNYQRSTWVRVLHCLRDEATWLIPDTQLREELRISISEKLIPAYRSFLGRSHIESGRHPENYIKYSVEDLENAVLDFFEGYPVSQHLRRRSDILIETRYDILMVDLISEGQTPVLTVQSSLCLFPNAFRLRLIGT